jgi:hypothetical protein
MPWACAPGEGPGESQPPRSGPLGSASEPLVRLEAAADAGPAVGSEPSSDAGAASDAAADPSNDCCTASGSAPSGPTGGCNDVTIEACVCAGDPFCCAVEYDALCAKQAVSRCGLDCDDRPPASDCCGASDVPGCTQPAVETCICDIDPFCCVFRFDQSCVNLGVARCNAACGEEVRP